MEYSASDIRHRSFSKGLRGFKTGEVQSFLNGLADAWEEKEERIENLEAKLEKTRERTEEREEKLDMKEESLTQLEQSLDEREEELEQKEKELRAITQRLQSTLENEADALTSLGDGEAGASTEEFNLDDSAAQPASERTNGKSGASSSSTASSSGASKSNATSDSKEKTSEEWVDSLFPNRLPGAEGDDASEVEDSDEPKKKEKSASESQFEAIKEDVQGKSADTSSASAEEDDDDTAPPTDEMERIWDVFDDPA